MREARLVRLDFFWYLSQGDYSGLVEDLGKGLFFNPFADSIVINLCYFLNLIHTRYPSCGVRRDQWQCGRSGSVLEEGGWGINRVAQDPGVWPCQHLLRKRHTLGDHFFEKIIFIASMFVWNQNTDPSLYQTTYKSEENLRRGAPKLHADLFGIEGSFRKLDIDWVFVCLLLWFMI